ncbi:MAG: hypothetical protein IIA72_10090 [Proteobacteria bacterium]|nr:hypothetical protein [Pseudomonadota bacterium]
MKELFKNINIYLFALFSLAFFAGVLVFLIVHYNEVLGLGTQREFSFLGISLPRRDTYQDDILLAVVSLAAMPLATASGSAWLFRVLAQAYRTLTDTDAFLTALHKIKTTLRELGTVAGPSLRFSEITGDQAVSSRDLWYLAAHFGSLVLLSVVAFTGVRDFSDESLLFYSFDGTYVLNHAANQWEWAEFVPYLGMNMLHSNGNMWYPLNANLIPAYVIAQSLFDVYTWPVAALTILAAELFLATWFLTVCLGFGPRIGLAAGWIVPLASLPFFVPTLLWQNLWGMPHWAHVVAMIAVIFGLFAVLGRRGTAHAVACAAAILFLAAWSFVSIPLRSGVAGYSLIIFGLAILFTSAGWRELAIKVIGGTVTIGRSDLSGDVDVRALNYSGESYDLKITAGAGSTVTFAGTVTTGANGLTVDPPDTINVNAPITSGGGNVSLTATNGVTVSAAIGSATNRPNSVSITAQNAILSGNITAGNSVSFAGVTKDITLTANILIDTQGKPLIADFGIAATMDEVGQDESTPSGTLPYMAP